MSFDPNINRKVDVDAVLCGTGEDAFLNICVKGHVPCWFRINGAGQEFQNRPKPFLVHPSDIRYLPVPTDSPSELTQAMDWYTPMDLLEALDLPVRANSHQWLGAQHTRDHLLEGTRHLSSPPVPRCFCCYMYGHKTINCPSLFEVLGRQHGNLCQPRIFCEPPFKPETYEAGEFQPLNRPAPPTVGARQSKRRVSNLPCKYFLQGHCPMGESCRYSHNPDLNRHHSIIEYKDELVDDYSRDWIRRQVNDRLVAWATGQVIESLMTAGSPLLDDRYEELVKAVAQRAWNVVIKKNLSLIHI